MNSEARGINVGAREGGGRKEIGAGPSGGLGKGRGKTWGDCTYLKSENSKFILLGCKLPCLSVGLRDGHASEWKVKQMLSNWLKVSGCGSNLMSFGKLVFTK